MKIDRITGLAMLGVCCAFGSAEMMAEHITPQQSLERLYDSSELKKSPSLLRQCVLKHTEVSSDGIETVYAFSKGEGNGFILTSADDRLPAVLGYSDSGTFDYESSAPSFKWWVNLYSQEAEDFLSRADESFNKNVFSSLPAELISGELPSVANAPKEDILPLIKTVWNQTPPFNNECPMLGMSRTVTGCIATALAQIMRYHSYPAVGFGSHSYKWNGQDLSLDFSTISFDWNSMLDNYNYGAGSETEKAEVAKLLYACGVSVDMNYGIKGSSSYGAYMPYALTEYFGYDKDIIYTKRIFHTDGEWNDMIYSELSSNRPVILGGKDSSGEGHEFLCDGFAEGFYHINWGWGGMSDGFFLLSDLKPETQGTGGGNGAYNSDVHLIYNIKKPDINVASSYPFSTSGGLVLENTSLGSNTRISFTNEGGIFNESLQNFTARLMLKFESATGDIVYSSGRDKMFSAMEGNKISGYGGIPERVPSSLAPGKYKVSLVYEAPDGDIRNVPFSVYTNSYVNVTVGSDKSFKSEPGEPLVRSQIKVIELYPKSTVETNVKTTYSISILNDGDISYEAGSIQIGFFEKGGENAIRKLTLNLSSLAPSINPYNFSFSTALPFANGEYEMICYDAFGEAISERFPLVVGDSGVESLFDNETNAVDIYSLNGVLIKKDAGKEYVQSLASGTYIIRNGIGVYKILIP